MRIVLRALSLSLALGAGCSRSPVGFDVSLPSALSANAVWIEVGAFRGVSCVALQPKLNGGIPDGFTARVAVNRRDATTPVPAFGDIPNAKYAFGAVARDESCAILAAGCSELDVGDVDRVNVTLGAVDPPQGKCPTGSICQAARCVPASNSTDPSVGAGCSLELLGAGPLGSSAGLDGTLLSAPAIATTKTGFIAVYRETAPGGSRAKLVLLPIDGSGGSLKPQEPDLAGRCAPAPGKEETDGVGLVIDENGGGMIALAKAPCADPPALELRNFQAESADDPARPALGKVILSTSKNEAPARLGAARAASLRKGNNVVAFTQSDTGRVSTMFADKGIDAPTGTFGGAGVTDAWVVANDKVLALLAVGPGGGSPKPVSDAGADGGADAGKGPAPATDESTMRLLVLPASTDLTMLDAAKNQPRPPITFPGAWGSIAAVSGRVVVLTDGNGPGRSVTYRAYDLGKDEEADTGGFSVEGTGKITAGDAVIRGNRAYFVALRAGQIGLQVFDNATTILTAVGSVSFSRETRISGINTVRDGRVAVAASDSRVAVVWTTAKSLGANDAPGGYAVFACTP